MMGKTNRAQIVTYVPPPFKAEVDQVVEALQARGERATVSSLSEEAMRAGWQAVRQRYQSLMPVGGSRPARKPRRRFASV